MLFYLRTAGARGLMDVGSSSSDDEDPNWKATIESIAAAATYGIKANNGSSTDSRFKTRNFDANEEEELMQGNSKKLKYYQQKTRKLLDDILEKNLDIVENLGIFSEDNSAKNGSGVRLFKDSPAGIVFDHKVEIQGPKTRPKILPPLASDEKSMKYKRKVQSVAVNGEYIIYEAKVAAQKSLLRLKTKDCMREEKIKMEKERISELKKLRGERWLPSISWEMQHNKSSKA